MDKLDRKFSGIITKNKDNSIVPQDQWMAFLAKDNAFPATLRFYRSECERLGADQEQINAIDDAIRRVDNWRLANPQLCKTPDVQTGELL